VIIELFPHANLTYFFACVGERYSTVVGQVESESELRREIIHRLCLGDMSRSELMRGLPLSESEVSTYKHLHTT
jgi:hypothetical protein